MPAMPERVGAQMTLMEWYNSLTEQEKILVRETLKLGYLKGSIPSNKNSTHIGILGLLEPNKLALAFRRRIKFMGGYDAFTDILCHLERSVSLCS